MTAELKNEGSWVDEFWKELEEEWRLDEERLAKAGAFRKQIETDTLPPELQEFKDLATAFVRELGDDDLANEENLGFIPDLQGVGKDLTTAGYFDLQILWMRIFEGERDKRGIPDPNDDIDPDHFMDLDEEGWDDGDPANEYIDPDEKLAPGE